MYIMTWDLKRNVEHSLCQLLCPPIRNPEDLICKGRKEKFNYTVGTDRYYDFQY